MAKKECPSCAMDVDSKVSVCPICGYEFPATNNVYVLVAIILLVISVMYLIL